MAIFADPAGITKKNGFTEMIMSTILSAPTAPEARTRKSWTVGLPATLKRWWVAYITWRIEQAAIAQLWKMSDREFKDIGLTRSAITCGLRGEGGARPANPSDVAEQTRARKRLP